MRSRFVVDSPKGDESEEEEQPVQSSSKKKKQPVAQTVSTSSSKRSRKRNAKAESEEEGQSEDEDEVSAIMNKRKSTAEKNTESNTQPVYSTKKLLKLDALEAQKQRLPVGSIKMGAPEKAPDYQCSAKSSAVASSLSPDDLSAAVASTTRLVLARQLNGKPLTGNEVASMVLTNLAGHSEKKDFNKLLLGYIRVEVSKRLRDVFGFELFAGGDELKIGDKWHITNALESDELKLLLESNPEEAEDGEDQNSDYGESQKEKDAHSDMDKQRGALIVVLAVIMLHKGEVSEADMTTDLAKFGMSDLTVTKLKKHNSSRISIPDFLARLVKQGFLVRQKRENVFYYTAGEKSENEVGKRSVLQFMMQTCNIVLDENDEEQLLRL